MGELTFRAGGQLEYSYWMTDDAEGESRYVRCDVTDRAAAYLMEPVRFDGEIYMRDLFSLLDRNPMLVEMFSRSYAAEYLDETRKGNAEVYTGEYDPSGIEYLELFYDWEKNRETRVLGGVHRLWVTGVGYKLRDDVFEDGYLLHRKGTRIGWAIKFSPVAHIFNYPLRFNRKVTVVDSRDITRTAHIFVVPFPTLAQVINAVMWELSWGGNPQQTEEFVEMIHEHSDEKHMSGPMSVEEFYELLGKPGNE
ncbi:hypothetical protein BJG93_00655 [Paraburkholderia sprentiae WSM5005]|uniref:Uncharacterized protein n=1 Tax=Paraburkholderia sprentiae WSM5005 TaxID=754502 RepID=A0A1I9YCP4_9BURK|nr:hypothetical protein [Paraburkholderia sprentiae]APA84077.1 hypothetical protein BJG93_00655 [Paraburkholderia sprentiae WSM5005]